MVRKAVQDALKNGGGFGGGTEVEGRGEAQGRRRRRGAESRRGGDQRCSAERLPGLTRADSMLLLCPIPSPLCVYAQADNHELRAYIGELMGRLNK